jgi:hypothetical protein
MHPSTTGNNIGTGGQSQKAFSLHQRRLHGHPLFSPIADAAQGRQADGTLDKGDDPSSSSTTDCCFTNGHRLGKARQLQARNLQLRSIPSRQHEM